MEGNSTNGASTNGHESVVNSKKVPPSVTKPAPKKRIDIGKIYEDDFLVLNIRLKQYDYGNVPYQSNWSARKTGYAKLGSNGLQYTESCYEECLRAILQE